MHTYGLRRLSDERLGRQLGAGDAAAFDELYRRYMHRLAAYGAHLLGDAAAGEDVAQSALLKAYGALRGGKGPERVRPWLYRIAHNAALDLAARRPEILSPAAIDEVAVESRPFAGALVEAVAALPDRQRRVYALREVHGLRIDETAAELGLSAAQVEQSLFAARNRLAELLTFGERLSCVAVRRLATGPLDLQERRGLKTHLRSCPACRDEVGARGIALSLPFLDWIRALPAVLAGGGAPIAAKVGVVAVAATLTGVPVALQDLRPAKPAPGLTVGGAAAQARTTVRPRSSESARQVVTTVMPAASVRHRTGGGSSAVVGSRRHGHGKNAGSSVAGSSSGRSGDDGAHSDGRDGGSAVFVSGDGGGHGSGNSGSAGGGGGGGDSGRGEPGDGGGGDQPVSPVVVSISSDGSSGAGRSDGEDGASGQVPASITGSTGGSDGSGSTSSGNDDSGRSGSDGGSSGGGGSGSNGSGLSSGGPGSGDSSDG